MGIESISTISRLLTQTARAYVKPLREIRSYRPFTGKMEELTGDVCNISKSLGFEEFFNGLISSGLGLFNNPKIKQAFIEKIQHNNMTLDELKKIMTEVDSKTFINLTNPTKTEVVFKQGGVKLNRTLDFREAEFVLKNNYSPQEMSELVNVREHLINGKQIRIEDADVVIKNKMNETAMERFVYLRRQQGFESDKALFGSYLKESEIETITNKEISKFLELKGKKITYQNSGGKTLEYTLPSEEAAYCAKYNFTETQVQRFAKLRNEYFAKDSVRNSGIETKFEVENILSWIKSDAKEKDIFRYTELLNNPERLNNMLLQGYRSYFERNPMINYNNILKRITISPTDVKYDKELFLACKSYIKDIPVKNLSQQEITFINNINKMEYIENSQNGQKLLSNISMFFDYKIRTPEQIKIYQELSSQGVNDAIEIAGNIELYNQIKRLASLQTELGVKELALLSRKIDLTKFDIIPVLNNLSGKWSKVCTGENEEVHKLFESAKKILRSGNREITTNLTSGDISKISRIGVNSNLYGQSLKLENGNLIFNDAQYGFKTAVQKIEIEGKPVLLIKNIENEGYYIAHEGAITKLNDLPDIDRDKLQKSLFGFSRYSKKQDEIYADAIEHFPIRIIDNKSECIIGKGLPTLGIEPITTFYMKDSELISHYQKVLAKLKDTGNLSVNNILRIMPNFATIQVNPYTTGKNGKMLYSISAEWKSSDGVKWQLRTHSTDLEYYMNSGNNAENSDWIFRLGHEENGIAKFFEFNEAKRKFTPTGDSLGRTSHIQIPHSPFTEEGNLLDNIHFQNIMRQISSNLV